MTVCDSSMYFVSCMVDDSCISWKLCTRTFILVIPCNAQTPHGTDSVASWSRDERTRIDFGSVSMTTMHEIWGKHYCHY